MWNDFFKNIKIGDKFRLLEKYRKGAQEAAKNNQCFYVVETYDKNTFSMQIVHNPDSRESIYEFFETLSLKQLREMRNAMQQYLQKP